MSDLDRPLEEDYYDASDVIARYASYEYLDPPERTILDGLGPGLAEMRVLDVGVGGGRTTVHVADRVLEYVGIDYSAGMVEACRRRFGGRVGPHVRFETADARAMPQFEDASFDFVWFSYNGLDAVGGLDDRLRALRELRRVCRPGGFVAFSSHNVQVLRRAFSFRRALARARQGNPLALLRPVKWRLMNPTLRRPAERDLAIVADERHGLRRVKVVYVRPRWQVGVLRDEGFGDIRMFLPDGSEIDPDADLDAREEHWLYYFCRTPLAE